MTPRMKERIALAAKLRADGLTLREIGKQLGVSGERARQLLKRAALQSAHIEAQAAFNKLYNDAVMKRIVETVLK